MNTSHPQSWIDDILKNEFGQPYMQQLQAFLLAENKAKKVIYPPKDHIFNAFNKTPFNEVKVVILGEDPYHGKGQANGLAFSVPKGISLPPSLQNIFKELSTDLCLPKPSHGDLRSWASQGVLLLNTTLTVEEGKARSHQKKGWETFTDRAISELSRQKIGLVFLLWGNSAKSKLYLIDQSKHHILTSVHPSPLSAYRGRRFFERNHFSQTNEFLKKQGLPSINWRID